MKILTATTQLSRDLSLSIMPKGATCMVHYLPGDSADKQLVWWQVSQPRRSRGNHSQPYTTSGSRNGSDGGSKSNPGSVIALYLAAGIASSSAAEITSRLAA